MVCPWFGSPQSLSGYTLGIQNFLIEFSPIPFPGSPGNCCASVIVLKIYYIIKKHFNFVNIRYIDTPIWFKCSLFKILNYKSPIFSTKAFPTIKGINSLFLFATLKCFRKWLKSYLL